jgi:hypothetical protein
MPANWCSTTSSPPALRVVVSGDAGQSTDRVVMRRLHPAGVDLRRGEPDRSGQVTQPHRHPGLHRPPDRLPLRGELGQRPERRPRTLAISGRLGPPG